MWQEQGKREQKLCLRPTCLNPPGYDQRDLILSYKPNFLKLYCVDKALREIVSNPILNPVYKDSNSVYLGAGLREVFITRTLGDYDARGPRTCLRNPAISRKRTVGYIKFFCPDDEMGIRYDQRILNNGF